MFFYLLILFTVVPAVELMLLIEVGSVIGAGNTILIIILTGVVGASLAKYQGLITLQKIQSSLNKGNMPTSEMLDGLMILVGGIVLLTPGLITDAIGFFLLIPLTRSIIKLFVRKKMEAMIKNGQVVHFNAASKRDDFIDV